jgi:hypothetical protein
MSCETKTCNRLSRRISNLQKKLLKEQKRKLEKERGNSIRRTLEFQDNWRKVPNFKYLLDHFGMALATINPKNGHITSTGKLEYRAQGSNWILCYDRNGKYCTILHNSKYVDWDKKESSKGNEGRFHYKMM